MTVREWIRERAIRGKPMFSLETFKKPFPSLSRQTMSNALSLLSFLILTRPKMKKAALARGRLLDSVSGVRFKLLTL